MILAVLASDQQKEEIARSVFFRHHELVFSENNSLWANHSADAFIDLGFDLSSERISKLEKLLPKPVMVTAVTETLADIGADFIRFNGWSGFLEGSCLEAAASSEMQKKGTALFGDELIFVKDEPGFVSARVVAMIINEAYLTWEAGTSSQGEIDIAMKLGTGYPFGPFEWAAKIGPGRVAALLERLKNQNPIYELARGMRNLRI